MATKQELAQLTQQALILAGFVRLAETICDTPGIQRK